MLFLAPTWTLDQALAALQAGAIGCLSAGITAGELVVALRQAARGEVTLLSNKETAQRLFLSVRTVENYLAYIYGKLGVHSRTEAAVLALQQGWL